MRIIHTADIHLDSPLSGLAARAGRRSSELVGATRRAFTAMVDYAIETRVDLILIAGDLYDGDWKDFSTGLFFVSATAKLRRAGIQVGVIKGNHDAESHMTRALTWPSNVHVFRSDRAETWIPKGLPVAVHGRSFPRRDVTENIATSYPDPVAGHLNIGLLHTAADGKQGHAPYAPCTVGELTAKGYDYWALGHVHSRAVLNEDPWIVFPGNLQGRHATETGAKGFTLLTVQDQHVTAVEHIPIDVVRWTQVRVDLTGCADFAEACSRIRERIAKAVYEADGRTLAMRLVIGGKTSVHREIAGDIERINAECVGLAEQCGDVWLEKVVVNTTEFDSELSVDADALGELLRTVDEVQADPDLMQALRGDLEQSLSRVPQRVKELGGFKEFDDPALGSILEGAAATLRHRILSHR